MEVCVASKSSSSFLTFSISGQIIVLRNDLVWKARVMIPGALFSQYATLYTCSLGSWARKCPDCPVIMYVCMYVAGSVCGEPFGATEKKRWCLLSSGSSSSAEFFYSLTLLLSPFSLSPLFLFLPFLPLPSLSSLPFLPLSSSPSNQLTALVTSFYLKLSEHFTHPQFLQQIREIGFLAQFESLLSTFGRCGTLSVLVDVWMCRFSGDESGMLEDTCVAVAELGTVTFQVYAFIGVKILFATCLKARLVLEGIVNVENVAFSVRNGFEEEKNLFPPGIEPGTLRVWGARDNRYTTETQLLSVFTISNYKAWFPLQLGALGRNPDLRFDFHISGTRFSFSSS